MESRVRLTFQRIMQRYILEDRTLLRSCFSIILSSVEFCMKSVIGQYIVTEGHINLPPLLPSSAVFSSGAYVYIDVAGGTKYW
jgi:hypothetical protein